MNLANRILLANAFREETAITELNEDAAFNVLTWLDKKGYLNQEAVAKARARKNQTNVVLRQIRNANRLPLKAELKTSATDHGSEYPGA